uniref:Uncharacterized protein n=1 Tax=Rhizophora mucronata TaxID=61149 RepID=A0A2P2Q2A7_RHIMU
MCCYLSFWDPPMFWMHSRIHEIFCSVPFILFYFNFMGS